MSKVSVIVPIYKGNSYLKQIIDMIEQNRKHANQDSKVDVELILINDFPEEKLCYSQEWGTNIQIIELCNEVNRGIHFSRVHGFIQSSGEYVLFLDQDDEISPIFLKEQLGAIGELDAMICNGKNRSSLIYKSRFELERAVNSEEYINHRDWIVSPGQVLIKRSAVPKEWLENIMYKNGADDYYLWILMFKKGRKFGIQDKVLFWHQITDVNTSNDIMKMDESVYEMLQILVKMECLTEGEAESIRKGRISVASDETVSMQMYQKEKSYKAALNLWMTLREREISVVNYLEHKGFINVAIYGYGMFGKHLYHELKKSVINVKYIIDKNADINLDNIEKIILGECMEDIDVIIVTPYMEFEEINDELKEYYSCQIISIQTLLLNADYEFISS